MLKKEYRSSVLIAAGTTVGNVLLMNSMLELLQEWNRTCIYSYCSIRTTFFTCF